MDMDNNEKSALEHSRAQLLSYVKGTLENSFLTLASVLKDLSEFRPKMLKSGQRFAVNMKIPLRIDRL